VNGTRRLRVTTVQRLFAPQDDIRQLAYGFDQETAAVLISRQAVFNTLTQETMDVIRWVDRLLIKLVARFAEYKKDDVNSFKLSREFGLYPQFMFYLRRSNFLQTFNASPDETEYYRHLLFRENVSNSLVMIQPALMQYTMESEEPVPVLLDIDSMRDDVILVLDTFFYIVIWHGDTVTKWKEAGYQDDPNYENFKTMLEAPIEEAKLVMQDRFPWPRFFICHAGDGNERKIKSKVNPSSLTSHNTTVDVSFLDLMFDRVAISSLRMSA